MKQQVAAGVLAASMFGGVGIAFVAHKVGANSDDPRSTTKSGASATTKTPKAPKASASTAAPGPSTRGRAPTASVRTRLPIVPVSSLRILAGAVGPVLAGMNKQAAYATGYFDADVPVPACDRVDDLVWKAGYRDVLDILTRDDGSVLSLGIRNPGPRTRSGLGIGSTYESVQGVLGDAVPVEAGYNQTGLFVSEGDGWIGFLFNTTPDAVTGTDTVTFIEVTRGAKPGLVRDGC